MSGGVEFVELPGAAGSARIEYQWLVPNRDAQATGDAAATGQGGAPLIVFLHEGLGSVAMWRAFPQQLCDAAGGRGLVYSRPGHGRSTPSAAATDFAVDYMHEQAHTLLPALLQALHVDPQAQPLYLLGHSDGGSITLLYAAAFPTLLTGAIVLAPHILVEDIAVASIAEAATTYRETDMGSRLARYHDDADAMFWRWNRIWRDPAFKAWSIEAHLTNLRVPVLAVQGLGDEYGTLEQIRGIARRHPDTEPLELPDCGHSAHRDQPDRVMAAAVRFMRRHSGAEAVAHASPPYPAL